MEPGRNELRRLADAIEVPAPPPLAALHRRARRRHTVRVAVTATVAAIALVGAVVVSTTQRHDPTRVATVGPAVTLPDQPDWSWVTPEKMYSRDGSPTGYGRRIGTAEGDLLIYLADGGACFDAASCADADDHFDEADLQRFVARSSVITATAADAPFAGWEVVVVPGSTADLHHGNNPDTEVPGVPEDQTMVGARNLRHVLADIPARPGGTEPRRVVFAGSGAGAFGVILSQSTIRAAFPDAEVTSVLDGAVVPPSGPGLPSCVLDRWQQLWGIDIPETWRESKGTPGTQPASNVYRRLAERFPEERFGLLAATGDTQLRSWYGRGGADCSSADDPLSADAMNAGVDAVVSLLADLEPWSSFVVDGPDGDILTSSASGDPATARQLWAWLDSLIEQR